MPLHLLETLPGACFFIDDTEAIVYANMSAQTMTDTPREILQGHSFWRAAAPLVSSMLYQAVRKTRRTREPAATEYVSPVSGNWLHVQLAPTVGGLMLLFHEKKESTRKSKMVTPRCRFATDVLENMYIEVGCLTPEGILLEINEASLTDAQILREQVIGLQFADTPWWTFYPGSQEQLRAAITCASRGETVRFETQVRPREGRDLHLEVTLTPHRDDEQQVAYLVYVGADITERKRAEEATHTLVDAIPHLVWIASPDGYATYSNHRLLTYLTMTNEQAGVVGWLAGVHPDDRQQLWEKWRTAVETGGPYEGEHRLQDGTSGAYRWFLARGVPQRNAQGAILCWVGTCTDIEEQKQAEQKLKESGQNWRVLAETVPQLVWIERADGYVEYVNQRYTDYVQAKLEQLQSTGWSRFLHPDDAQRTLSAWRHACESGEPYEIEYRLKQGQTGMYRWFLARAMPVREEGGRIVRWFGTCTDIEEQKRIEEALRQSQERANVLMNSSIIGIFVYTGDQIVDANDTFLRMTGYTREDLRAGQMNWMQMTPPEDLDRTRQARQELAVQQLMTPYEQEYICRDGHRLPVLVGAVAFQRAPRQGIAFVLDNAARKELERRKDDFINMASHELRTPLTALKMQTQLVRKQLEKQSHHEAASALFRVEGPIKQLERLIGELLDVSKIQAGRLVYIQEPVDLDALLQEIADTMHHLHPGYTILIHGRRQISLVGDRDRLRQVFTNLLSNAIKYAPEARIVEVGLCASEEAVTIQVQDHGPGIPHEQRDKIFERFYRDTGPSQQAVPGLGMGLYIVAEIVKGHRGIVTVDSDIGKGSTFTVTLPRKRDT
ncbi:MAG TPA: PAS domain S-box protein [Ktedonobacteraceae bacterium]